MHAHSSPSALDSFPLPVTCQTTTHHVWAGLSRVPIGICLTYKMPVLSVGCQLSTLAGRRKTSTSADRSNHGLSMCRQMLFALQSMCIQDRHFTIVHWAQQDTPMPKSGRHFSGCCFVAAGRSGEGSTVSRQLPFASTHQANPGQGIDDSISAVPSSRGSPGSQYNGSPEPSPQVCRQFAQAPCTCIE